MRTTKDVDLLIRRDDLPRARAAALSVEMDYFEVMGVGMFLERGDPNPRNAVRLVWAGDVSAPTTNCPLRRLSNDKRFRDDEFNPLGQRLEGIFLLDDDVNEFVFRGPTGDLSCFDILTIRDANNVRVNAHHRLKLPTVCSYAAVTQNINILRYVGQFARRAIFPMLLYR